jgi:hypothetical protein
VSSMHQIQYMKVGYCKWCNELRDPLRDTCTKWNTQQVAAQITTELDNRQAMWSRFLQLLRLSKSQNGSEETITLKSVFQLMLGGWVWMHGLLSCNDLGRHWLIAQTICYHPEVKSDF